MAHEFGILSNEIVRILKQIDYYVHGGNGGFTGEKN